MPSMRGEAVPRLWKDCNRYPSSGDIQHRIIEADPLHRLRLSLGEDIFGDQLTDPEYLKRLAIDAFEPIASFVWDKNPFELT